MSQANTTKMTDDHTSLRHQGLQLTVRQIWVTTGDGPSQGHRKKPFTLPPSNMLTKNEHGCIYNCAVICCIGKCVLIEFFNIISSIKKPTFDLLL